MKKLQKNNETVEAGNLVEKYPEGKKMEFTLTITEIQWNGYLPAGIKGKSEELPEVNVKLSPGAAMNKIFISNGSYNKPDYRKSGDMYTALMPGDKIKVSGEIKRFNTELLLVTFRKVQLIDVVFWEKTEEVKAAEKLEQDIANGTYVPPRSTLKTLKTLSDAMDSNISNEIYLRQYENEEPRLNTLKMIAQFEYGTDSNENVEKIKSYIKLSENDKLESMIGAANVKNDEKLQEIQKWLASLTTAIREFIWDTDKDYFNELFGWSR